MYAHVYVSVHATCDYAYSAQAIESRRRGRDGASDEQYVKQIRAEAVSNEHRRCRRESRRCLETEKCCKQRSLYLKKDLLGSGAAQLHLYCTHQQKKYSNK